MQTVKAAPIVGPAVPDETRLRLAKPIRELDEFLEFLEQVEALFGSLRRPRPSTTGDRFLL